jgi:hypothetical protein
MLLAITAFLVAASSPPARPPDGTYTYQALVNGAVFQTDTITITTSATSIVVHDAASIPSRSITAVATTTYDASSLAETGYTADFTLQSGSQHTDTTFAPGVITVRVPGQSVALKADASAPLEIVTDNLAGTAIMIPALLHKSGAQALTFAVLSGGTTMVFHAAPAHAARPPGVPSGDEALTLTNPQLSEVYWFDPARFTVDAISIPSQSAVITRSR